MNKKLIVSLVIILVVVVVFIFIGKKSENKDFPNHGVVDENKLVELCFAKFGAPNERGFADKYTLQMLLDNKNGKVSGELKFLPAEKDSKVGKYEGAVSAVDKVMMARTIDAWWDTMAEGMNNTEQLKIIFGEGTASVGTGEMVDRGDGVYIYKDQAKVQYNIELTDVACKDLTIRDNVETYVRTNISILSPIKAVLGGSWYVLGVNTNLSTNSGTVVYEDGHVQEKKNFTFTLNEKGEVSSLVIK